MSYNRAVSANRDTVKDYFAKLAATTYARLNILAKPMQIFNMDESGMTVVHKPGKVVTELGSWRNIWSLTSGEKGKTHILVCCVSAAGYVLPPQFLIYPRKRMKGFLPHTAFACSGNGWIMKQIYFD